MCAGAAHGQHPVRGACLLYTSETIVRKLAAQVDNIGILFPPIPKQSLFETILIDGALPRKTFSMGTAADKRFYLECRKIKP